MGPSNGYLVPLRSTLFLIGTIWSGMCRPFRPRVSHLEPDLSNEILPRYVQHCS